MSREKLTPKQEVDLLYAKLKPLSACMGGLAQVCSYSSLEELWENWPRADWAVWFVARVMGKKKTMEVLTPAVYHYLRVAHPRLARKYRGKNFDVAIGALTVLDKQSMRDVGIIDDSQGIREEPTKTYWSANSANVTTNEIIGGLREKEVDGEKVLLALVRKVVPLPLFLRTARALIRRRPARPKD